MDDNKSKWISLGSLAVLAALIIFVGGMYVTENRRFPYPQVKKAHYILQGLMSDGEVIPEGRRVPAPEGAARDFATVHDAEAAIGSGYYAMMLWDVPLGMYSVRLFDAGGTLIHTWPIDEMSFTDKAIDHNNRHHPMYVLPDGSIVVGFDELPVMVRLDACGKAVWTREDGYYHHSFSPSADGGIWTWYTKPSDYSNLVQRQDIVKFDPETGEDMVRMNFNTDVVMRNADSPLAFSLFKDYEFPPHDVWQHDIFHPNDLEELMPDRADAFPMFEAGDLLMSLRELDMVAVFGQDGVLKWAQYGPWLRQHDPDFEADGTIAIFNNSRHRPRSAIYAIDPATNKVTDPLSEMTAPFKSVWRGKHQTLPNGNILITIPEQGQALEVVPPGNKIAVEFNNPAAGGIPFNEDLANARWFPQDYFTTLPSCSQ